MWVSPKNPQSIKAAEYLVQAPSFVLWTRPLCSRPLSYLNDSCRFVITSNTVWCPIGTLRARTPRSGASEDGQFVFQYTWVLACGCCDSVVFSNYSLILQEQQIPTTWAWSGRTWSQSWSWSKPLVWRPGIPFNRLCSVFPSILELWGLLCSSIQVWNIFTRRLRWKFQDSWAEWIAWFRQWSN